MIASLIPAAMVIPYLKVYVEVINCIYYLKKELCKHLDCL